jgi:cold shock CspA family protein/ribosome-associated translation inhibitor RaiA
MQLEPSITFRGIGPSEALDTDIRQRIHKLETYYGGIMGCRILVEFAQRHHEVGNRYHVRIDLTVPGEQIVVAHEASLRARVRDEAVLRARKAFEPDPERKHAHVAVRQAFDIARRRLQDYARRQRGAVKALVHQPRGRVTHLYPERDYGYLQAEDGHEVYFQKQSVVKDAFDRLDVGSPVSFVEEAGHKGPQASTVRLLRPRRRRRAAAAERTASSAR